MTIRATTPRVMVIQLENGEPVIDYGPYESLEEAEDFIRWAQGVDKSWDVSCTYDIAILKEDITE